MFATTRNDGNIFTANKHGSIRIRIIHHQIPVVTTMRKNM